MSAERAEALAAWVGRSEEASDEAAVASAQALWATLDRPPEDIGDGDALPPLFHWLYCRDVAPGGRLDADGHRRRGGFLPPLPGMRRMWAGGRVDFAGAIPAGASLRRRSEVRAVTPKDGRSGPLVLVTVRHRITLPGPDGRGGRSAVEETQQLVFVSGAPPAASASANAATSGAAVPSDAADWAWRETVTPDAVMLFRFSALTFNAHRIHYDRDYARGVEGYPDLVVHGPLTALLLADLAARRANGGLRSFAYRARSPLFVDRPIRLEARPEGSRPQGGTLRLRALDDAGRVAMTATAEVRR